MNAKLIAMDAILVNDDGNVLAVVLLDDELIDANGLNAVN